MLLTRCRLAVWQITFVRAEIFSAPPGAADPWGSNMGGRTVVVSHLFANNRKKWGTGPWTPDHIGGAVHCLSPGGFAVTARLKSCPFKTVCFRGQATMKKIGVLFGMENSFPGALVEHINARNVDGIRGRVRADRRGAHGQAAPLRGHRRPHLARHPVLPRLSEERGAQRHGRHQQSVLVVGRRQVLQLRAGRKARRGRAADRAPAAQEASRGNDRPLHAQPRVSRSNWDAVFRLRGRARLS